ncbi:copper chaperone PCu(A)C [Mycolicibacterium psychrotolerans]|uniref:hypothetical protein n=1 Tax=Mycolicibacterium psychrotolerans TaxID=216929 RepID=UPI001FE66A62|nr:hypothetical protein [Mycolicibacterium psychrotolerans]
MRSPNRGTGSTTQETTVENVYIVPAFLPGRCAIQLDAGAAMRFTVTNNRGADPEKLLGVSTDAAQATRLPATTEIPPKATVAYGQPHPGDPGGSLRMGPARLDGLDPDLRPATTADVIFHFDRAGDITLPVAVEACPVQMP